MTIESRSLKILLAGDHNVVKQFPLFGTGEPLYLWAEKGLICWELATTDTFGTMDWRDAAKRVLALSQMVLNSSEGGYADERRAMQKFISDMERIIRQAKEQGGPNDDGAAAEHRRRRAKTVSLRRSVDAVDPFPEIY